jgi:hypothetical protein
MTPASNNTALVEAIDGGGGAAKQQKRASADHSIKPLSEAGVLQRILGYVGPGYWLLVALVSKEWRESYLQVSEQQMIGLDSQYAEIEVTCEPHMTLLKAAVASAAVIKLACDCGLRFDSSRLQFIAGRWGDTATLSAAFEFGMPLSAFICVGAATGGCLDVSMWLVIDQKCPVVPSISMPAAASGSVPVLNFFKQSGITFTVDTACSAARAGHQHVIDYLHAEACPIDQSVYLAAARFGHVHVLQRLRELECAWDSEQLCRLAAIKGHVHVLQWAKQHGALFTEGIMTQAAAGGHTEVCEYLLAQQCPHSDVACFAAALHCRLGTLQWSLEHGCSYNASSLWTVAADYGHISVLSYLQQIGVVASPDVLPNVLFVAGARSHLAVAQWLKAYGVQWLAVLTMQGVDDELLQWEGAVLEWARAEGCTSPLQL